MQFYLDRFLEFIPEGGSILDLGCGSGRDSEYFISMGYDVTALDGSEEMCSLASVHIGKEVLHMSFSEMDFDDVFDGVWANASLLHVPKNEMENILAKIIRSLKQDGILYMTFRYGDFEGIEEERYFTNYRSRELKELVAGFEELELIDIKKYKDVRPELDREWIHALVRKQ
jgi:SAM-dependent methyltransferase